MKIDCIRNFLKDNLNESRYVHSLAVAKTAKKVAKIHGLDQKICTFAGLVHDICRDFTSSDLNALSLSHRENLLLEHGSAGSELLHNKFHISDRSILDAVKYHTSGKRDLDPIGKVIFVSDYLEPNRTHLTNDEREQFFAMDLDEMVLCIAKNTKRYLLACGKSLENNMLEMIWQLEKKERAQL